MLQANGPRPDHYLYTSILNKRTRNKRRFRKANVDRSNVVLVAISLDPFQAQSANIEVPLWEWGLNDDAALMVDDLMRGGNDIWVGKHRTISLDPRTLPFGIWRARPREIS